LERGGEYLTFKQIGEKKGKIKKGAKSEIIVYYKNLEITDEDGEEKTVPLLRYYRVFHIDDTEGIESKIPEVVKEFTPIQECENIIKNYKTCPKIKHGYNQAYYSPSEDIIAMPNKKQFKGKEEYYSTLFHESIHSTGHKSRLNRFEKEKQIAFGSEDYSKEELIAEIGSAMLCSYCGIEKTIDNQASYIASWLQVLRNDKNFVIQASSKAQKAYDYILGI
jgi:antirestriction protein ArdC